MRFTISYSAFEAFVRAYYAEGKYPGQRLGQAFVNRFLPGDQTWPELFYCEDVNKAFSLITSEVHIEG